MAATSGAQDRDMRPSGESYALVAGMRWRRGFPGDASQIGEMRQWLKSLLPDCPARDDVVLIATELGSNAVRHTVSGQDGWFTVEISWRASVVRVAVADDGAPGGPRVIDDPAGVHGRGLLVVRGLSARSGVCGDDRGRLVWADVLWDAAGPMASRDQYEAVIRDGQAVLASRFAGVPAWFGWSTLQWWALVGGELVAAPSAEELASLLSRALAPRPRDTAGVGTRPARGAVRNIWPGVPALRSCRGDGPLPGAEQHSTGPGGHGGPRVSSAAQARNREARAAVPGLASTG